MTWQGSSGAAGTGQCSSHSTLQLGATQKSALTIVVLLQCEEFLLKERGNTRRKPALIGTLRQDGIVLAVGLFPNTQSLHSLHLYGFVHSTLPD